MIPDLDPAEYKAQYVAMAKATEGYEAAWKKYEPLPQTPEEAKIWKEFVPVWQQWKAATATFLEQMRKLEAMDLGDPGELSDKMGTFRGDHYKLVANLQTLLHGNVAFEGGESHETCNLGKWLTTFKTTNPQILGVMKALAEPHAQIPCRGEKDQGIGCRR